MRQVDQGHGPGMEIAAKTESRKEHLVKATQLNATNSRHMFWAKRDRGTGTTAAWRPIVEGVRPAWKARTEDVKASIVFCRSEL